MNFVIVAAGYYPEVDPESYCGTRFASSLAALGHNVHVVTYWHPESMFNADYAKLTNPNVKVTRIDTRNLPKAKWPFIDLRRFIVRDGDQPAITEFIAVTKKILRSYDHPVLITRTYSWFALYVGWYCRKHAEKWVAHFSDPMLDFKPVCRLDVLRRWSLKFWMRRAMRKADAISVTCKRVRRYYREQLGPCVDRAKFIVTTHIGDFKLEKKVGRESRSTEERRLILHDGDIYRGRGLLMVEAVDRLNAEGFPCVFLQGRDVRGDADRAKLLASPNCKIVGRDAPPELKALAKSAQVSFVADFDTPNLSYSPFLMSKFVYQLFTDKPIVVLSKLESEKHDYCVAYPEAGLFFAETGNVASLVAAVKAAFACDPAKIDRSRIRNAFSEKTIGENFVKEVDAS